MNQYDAAATPMWRCAREDRVPDGLFNEILWKGIKGMEAKAPDPSGAAFVRGRKDKDDDD